MMQRVAFVGPLPPPVNGFANMCGLMLARLRETTRVDVFNRAPYANSRARSLLVQLLRPFGYAMSCVRGRQGALYLALSGGHGQLLDLPYVLIAKLFRRPIYIHHHSYAYINASNATSKWFFRCVRSDCHIVLSPGMGAALAQRYQLAPDRIRVVSNAAFFNMSDTVPPVHEQAEQIRIGLLSNITVDKGFVEFFGILQALRAQGVRFKASIAGPVAPAARRKFESLLAEAPEAQYLGPLYGNAKEAFYRHLDVFAFPTRYANEAEPLVLYEAMQASVYVVACDRGAIRDMLGDAGLVAPGEAIVTRAAERIRQLSEDRDALASAKAASRLQAQHVSSAAAADLSDFLRCVSRLHPDSSSRPA